MNIEKGRNIIEIDKKIRDTNESIKKRRCHKMKTIVIFYSLGGNTKYVSEIIAKELKADLIELKTKKVYPSSGLKKYIWGGKSVLFKEEPELTNEMIDLDSYENIVLGTPIWAGGYATPYNTFLKQYKVTGKNIAFVACHAGRGAENGFKMFKEVLKDNQFVGEMDFVDPLKKDKDVNVEKAVQWANHLSFE